MGFNRDEYGAGLMTFGRKGGAIDVSSSDAELGESVKAVVVTAEGTVSYRPCGEADGTIDFGSLPVGYVLPHIPGVIFTSGTTAELATVDD